MRPRAVVFDFNGTISNDEPILCVIFQRLFAAHGKPLAAQDYYDRLAGLSDPEIVRTWLGRDHPAVAEVIEQRIALYRAAVADGSSISDSVRAAVRCAAERVPVGIVSGASREEIAPVLEAAGLGEVVVFEDTEAGIAAAKSAGMRCIGVLGTLAEERLAAADELVPGIDRTVVENLFA